MTKPVEPHELSGLIDGELDPARAAEVRRAVEADPALGEELARLERLDRAWAAAGVGAGFAPRVALSPPRRGRLPLAAALALGLPLLVAVRFLPLLGAAPALAVPVHLLVLAQIAAGLAWLDARTRGPAAAAARTGTAPLARGGP